MLIDFPLWAIPLIGVAVASGAFLLWLAWSVIQVWDVDPWD